jgi:hypothetical protein
MRLLLLILDGLIAYWALRIIDTAPRFSSWAEQGRAILAYIVFLVCGIVAFMLLPPDHPSDRSQIYATVAMVCWVFIGMLWLLRKAPGDLRLPGWIMRPWGVLDWALIAIVFASATVAAMG